MTTNREGMTRMICGSADQTKFCLVGEDINIKYKLGEALDRCKGVGCLGRECPTQYYVHDEYVEAMKALGATVWGEE